MRYNIILISASLLLLLFAIVFDVNYINYQAPIAYAQWEKITLYDFRAFKKPGNELEGSNEFAYIKSSRKIRYLNDSTFEITSFFYPTRSYVYDDEIHSPGLLEHELYHFQITEYFSRLLRRDIITNGIVSTADHINQRNDEYIISESEMQNDYDTQTDHSYVLDKQEEWEKYIDSLNNNLAEYANPVFFVKK